MSLLHQPIMSNSVRKSISSEGNFIFHKATGNPCLCQSLTCACALLVRVSQILLQNFSFQGLALSTVVL